VGIVKYEENRKGDPDWTDEYSGNKDLMISLCEDKEMGPAVPSWSRELITDNSTDPGYNQGQPKVIEFHISSLLPDC